MKKRLFSRYGWYSHGRAFVKADGTTYVAGWWEYAGFNLYANVPLLECSIAVDERTSA